MRLLILAVAGALVGAVGSRASVEAGKPVAIVPAPKETAGSDAIDASALDPSVDACTDFYRHACGGFIAATKLDANAPSVSLTGRTFDAHLDRQLSSLFARPIAGDAELDRLRIFYQSCLDDGTASDRAIVRQWLGRIDAARSVSDIERLSLDLSRIGVDAFFTYAGQVDRTDRSRYRGEIDGPYLWGRKAVVAQAFVDAGQPRPDAEADADAVMAMITALDAKRGDRYDAKTAEHPQSLSDLERLAPAIDWPAFFDMVGAPRDRAVNVVSLDHLRTVQQLLATRSPAELRALLRWAYLSSLRGELPRPYNEAFGDIGPALRVKLADAPGRCRDATIRAMGVEFSRQYAEHILGWKARDVARRIAGDIKTTIVASIAQDRWLSASARKATAAKLARTDLKIGFPDHWPAVGRYPLDPHGFFGNVLAARRFEQQRLWRRAQQRRVRTDWEMTVSPWVGEGMAAARLVVPNGFPDAFSNSLIMTAAFLSAPRFDANQAPELNYGTFGAVFAHEFVHVAESHMFGADGRDAELWSPEDIASAKKQDQCVVAQADAYVPLPGLKMSGADQFDENVADYGGVRLAFAALQARLGGRLYIRDASGTSPAQRFFYRYAQNYCVAQTDATLRGSIAGDSHGPPAFRVNGPLSNMPAFGRAFACKTGAAMMRSPERQCRVW